MHVYTYTCKQASTHTHIHIFLYPKRSQHYILQRRKVEVKRGQGASCYRRQAWGTACTCREWPPTPLRWCSNTPPSSGCRCVGLCTRLSHSLAGCACSSGSPSGGNRHSRCPCGNLTQQKAADIIFKTKRTWLTTWAKKGKYDAVWQMDGITVCSCECLAC